MRKVLALLLCCLSVVAFALHKPQCITPSTFIQRLVNTHHYNAQRAFATLALAHVQPKILKIIQHPYERLPWYRYQQFFLKQSRITAGQRFTYHYRSLLRDASVKYGVPSTVIAAILGIETNYGQAKLPYRVLDALTTLSFHYPKRCQFFAQQLADYFLLIRRYNLNPTLLYGSYAGAIGIPQFMPSAYLDYAVSYHHGRIDLYHSMPSAILSVANYFKKHGWHAHQAIAQRIQHCNTKCFHLVSSKVDLHLNEKDLREAKLHLPHGIHKASIIALLFKQSYQFWLVYPNFKALMSYNPSIDYTMAAYQLSQRISYTKVHDRHILTARTATASTRSARRSSHHVRSAVARKSQTHRRVTRKSHSVGTARRAQLRHHAAKTSAQPAAKKRRTAQQPR